MNRLGIIAGGGELPHIGLKEAKQKGENPFILCIAESDYPKGTHSGIEIPIHITKIGHIIQTCKKNKIDRLLLLGKVKKEILFSNLKFDLKALAILAKSINRNDYSLFQGVAAEFEKEKIKIISQKTYLQSLLLTEGRYTKRKFSKPELEDIEFGMRYAVTIADLDIGQTVIVKDKIVIAVEAVEGTDEAIKRGGSLSRGKSAIVCKSTKQKQDDRFDLPAIGRNTLDAMKLAGCKTLVFKANEAIIVNPVDLISYAESLKIDLVSYKDGVKNINGPQKKYSPN